MTSQGQRDTAGDRDWFDDLMQEGRDISREMSRLLENRRWEPRNEPFRGFGSPPGRF